MRSIRPAAAPAVAVLAFSILFVGGTGSANAAFRGRNGRIAFSRIARSHSGGFRDTVRTVTKRGRHPRRLTSGCCNDDPAYSPSGARLAFSRNGHIFTMAADGTGLHRVTRGKRYRGKKFSDFEPSWSPNGGRIVFERRYENSKVRFDLLTVRAGGSKPRLLERGDLSEPDPSWAPNGNKIAFVASGSASTPAPHNPGIYTVRPSGAGAKLVLKVGNEKAGLDWSPSARRLAFARGSGSGTQVFTVRANGAHQTQVTHTGKAAFDPAFSPNGTQIVFTSRGALHVVRASGSKPSVLLHRSGRGSDVTPSWQPR